MHTKAIAHEGNIRARKPQGLHIEALIRIIRRDDRFELEVFTDYDPVRGPIEMTEHDLAALNHDMQVKVGSLVTEISGQAPPMSIRREQIRPLAEVGHYAFNRIFGHRDLELARKLLSNDRTANIQIVADDFFLPWELLYPIGLDKPLDCKHFWGMNYIISRVIARDSHQHAGTRAPCEIQVTSRPHVGLLFNANLEYVITREKPFFKRLADERRIALHELRPLYPEYKATEMQEFTEFWGNRLNIVHFACHAVYEDQSPHQSYFVVTRDFPITLQDMDVYGVTIDSYPLVILNACETGNLNPLYTSHFASAFLKYGARGVVATDCAVPDAFAAEFAERLYARLLAGKPLGESLLAVRQQFLTECNNPSGLLYSMYASPSIRIKVKGARR